MRLNMEQRRIIEVEPAGHMLVKGVAGSGKTTVAVHRIDFLRQHYCPEDDDHILLVTYNKTLLKYIEHQYNHIESDELAEGFMPSNAKIDMTNIDRLMYRYFKKYEKRHQKSFQIMKSFRRHHYLQKALLEIKSQYEDIAVLTPKNSNFLLDEMNWIKACDIADLETYQDIDRIGRSEGGSGNPQKLTKNSKTRESIYTLMEKYDQMLAHDGLIDFPTMNKLALQEALEHPSEQYTHIIIDESQDLSKAQLKFLQQLHKDTPYSSIMFVADNTQSIYSQSWLGKGRPYTTIGYDMSGKARVLSKNYRTTTEISKAAYSLIEHDEQINSNVDFVKPALIDRHGHEPIYRFFMTTEEQVAFYINEIKALQADYELRDICIIAKERKRIENAELELEKAGIPAQALNINQEVPDFEANTVKLTTMHSIKGLEFKVIFLIDLNEHVIPHPNSIAEQELLTEERKLLYVGMTRAKELLYMSSVRRPSRFVKEIDNAFLRFKKDMKLRPFRSIPMSEFQLRNDIVDPNSREELTRQWLLRELVDVYKYPIELMEIEYGVQQFSKRGYVDVVVMIDVEGKQVPYIFVEVKSFGTGIATGLEQLKTYMEADQSVRYGIVTDGIEIKIISRQGEEVTDIPPCLPQFLPQTKQAQTYKNLRNNDTYIYYRDVDDAANIEVVNKETQLGIDVAKQTDIPVIGDVAAGLPITVDVQFDEMITLPTEWVINQKETFALRVTGDSMIGAGIDKGDIAIVHRQEAVASGDIVIAVIGEEATMKKYMPMGNEILLISENPKYEPINMNPEDVYINGKVIGVLKDK